MERDGDGRVVAEVVAVGTELLLGDHVDTNSAHISRRLAEIGVDVYRHTTVGDNVGRIAAALHEACTRADVVLVTGGLGPTQDDLTRDAVAELAGVPLERRDDLAERLVAWFAGRGRPMPANNLRQADLPAGATPLEPVGTAPGFAVDVGGARVWCMPGVPREMHVMLDRDVLPVLRDRAGTATTVSRVVRTAGMSESGVAEAVADLVEELDRTRAATVAFLASKGETRVRVTGRGATRDDALAVLDPIVAGVLDRLGAGVVGVDDEGVEHAIGRRLTAAGSTLAVAESITGGGVGARLVGVPGASAWFRGGLTTYATDSKASVAGVDPDVLDDEGPVSEAVAGELASGARERLGADVGLAVVGEAGPVASTPQPIGTVCLGVALAGGAVRTTTVRLPSRTRADLQEFAASAALDFLRRRLDEA